MRLDKTNTRSSLTAGKCTPNTNTYHSYFQYKTLPGWSISDVEYCQWKKILSATDKSKTVDSTTVTLTDDETSLNLCAYKWGTDIAYFQS